MFLNVAAQRGLGGSSYPHQLFAVAQTMGQGMMATQIMSTWPDVINAYMGPANPSHDARTKYDVNNGITLMNRGIKSAINYNGIAQIRKRKRQSRPQQKVPQDLEGRSSKKQRANTAGPTGESADPDDIARIRALAYP